MADENHLEILRQGVEVWNHWRKNNPDIEPDLERADLEKAELEGANLGSANLVGANLIHANLKSAELIRADFIRTNLRDANLTDANLTCAKLYSANLLNAILIDANLCNANLVRAKLDKAKLNRANLLNATLNRTQALATIFEGATLTGACIEDWNINRKTNLQNVQCDYIYSKEIYSEYENKWIFSERRPHDPNKIFAPGEFAKLFQKALETIDLLFQNGVEWQAVAYSLKNIQVLNENIPLTIQKIENKGDGDVLISVNVPENANKGKIEGDFWQGYEFAHKALEGQYKARLEDKDKEINRLFHIVNQQRELIGDSQKLLAESSTTINLEKGNYYNQSGKFGMGHNQGDISGDTKIAGEIKENEDGKHD